jgi:hypothetical protein
MLPRNVRHLHHKDPSRSCSQCASTRTTSLTLYPNLQLSSYKYHGQLVHSESCYLPMYDIMVNLIYSTCSSYHDYPLTYLAVSEHPRHHSPGALPLHIEMSPPNIRVSNLLFSSAAQCHNSDGDRKSRAPQTLKCRLTANFWSTLHTWKLR